ncbi:hypothetical protein GE061_014631 [Apolygus lucorum]|uniref:Uncharacterized protein n=1 Tax=Apolygus lucorum TaxID=248454 RepID=A0A8S9XJX1_APOLU|nr:hypothetical protein GE061_014631 [Apolygus lucorum]
MPFSLFEDPSTSVFQKKEEIWKRTQLLAKHPFSYRSCPGLLSLAVCLHLTRNPRSLHPQPSTKSVPFVE